MTRHLFKPVPPPSPRRGTIRLALLDAAGLALFAVAVAAVFLGGME